MVSTTRAAVVSAARNDGARDATSGYGVAVDSGFAGRSLCKKKKFVEVLYIPVQKGHDGCYQ